MKLKILCHTELPEDMYDELNKIASELGVDPAELAKRATSDLCKNFKKTKAA